MKLKTIIKHKNTVGLYLLSIANLLVMHYYILLTCRLENYSDVVMWMDNLLGAVVDVTVVLAVALVLMWGRLRPALIATAIVTLLWAWCNVVYARFFHHYIPFSAIGQAGTLADGFMLSNVMAGVRSFDLVFVALAAIAVPLSVRCGRGRWAQAVPFLTAVPASLIAADLLFHLLFCLVTPGMASAGYFKRRMMTRHFGLMHSSAEPNWSTFHRGCVRQLVVPNIWYAFSSMTLTDGQRAAIQAEYSDQAQRISPAGAQAAGKNIIFIIVESYLSATSDLKVMGGASKREEEVTPFLNALKRDSTVYYNGQLRPNISIGESSDGQFLYMTGLLPLRSEVTVTKAKHASLPGLPKLLKEEGLIGEARMVIPTLPSMWEQERMCEQYGFDHLYSSADYEGGAYWYLSDRQLFDYAAALDGNGGASQPFLSVLLTMTMHQPYTEPKDSTFIVDDPSLTEQYRNYLSACHYTDRQIAWYLGQLKAKGLYDTSLIIIVADHHAHPALFDMEEGELPTDIPLYIVNGGMSSATAWQGPCNQLDVYTTLLDLLGTKSAWRGFGHTLLTSDYHDSLKPALWTMSEEIVLGNYFEQ